MFLQLTHTQWWPPRSGDSKQQQELLGEHGQSQERPGKRSLTKGAHLEAFCSTSPPGRGGHRLGRKGWAHHKWTLPAFPTGLALLQQRNTLTVWVSYKLDKSAVPVEDCCSLKWSANGTGSDAYTLLQLQMNCCVSAKAFIHPSGIFSNM